MPSLYDAPQIDALIHCRKCQGNSFTVMNNFHVLVLTCTKCGSQIVSTHD